MFQIHIICNFSNSCTNSSVMFYMSMEFNFCKETQTIDGFRLVTGYIAHLQIVTTSNCSAIANSHTQQFTTARTKSSQSAVSSPVFAW
jgi:hypothetical protein